MSASVERGWSERWSPLGGLISVVAFIVVFAATSGDTGNTPEEVIAYADDHHTDVIVQSIVVLVALPLLLWFVAGLFARARRWRSQTAPALVLAGGVGFALLLFIATTIWSAPLADFPGDAEPTAAANTYLYIDDIGWVTLGGAGICFAVMAIAMSVAALREGVVPTWLGWLGALVGLIAAATIAFVGLFAWLAWLLVVSLLLLVRRA
jgi:hypothetical protein